jgi:hypothetical protein
LVLGPSIGRKGFWLERLGGGLVKGLPKPPDGSASPISERRRKLVNTTLKLLIYAHRDTEKLLADVAGN